ncbi:hypothetical protein P691DRAFT_725098 [Macrolepiota fuliginosa MF-IS2]|uniref:Uncharacterized protein n=1 Tax=Macrolepiota fuliginosa MF-IS2 TaxID=1400762 RepID=A0A9P5XI88_9AGAR|nr:hypothetical protein P691DRAFT_725098 [Macrolepiota fuliginosa MF-IS2]
MKKRTSSLSKPSSSTIQDEREQRRQQYRKQLDTAVDEEEDPLALYHEFVQWTTRSYGENDPNSGLLQLLEEVTRKFKNDPLYKADLRYLKLWTLYAKHCERHGALSIYKYLMTNEIGISYSLLYEEYANALELAGRKQDADTIYRRGIKKQVRPLERLKSKYKDFQARAGTASSVPPSSSRIASKSSSGNPAEDALRKNPLKNHVSGATSGTSRSSPAPTAPTANLISTNSTAASRYALMMAPPAPGKRQEKLRFNLPLLFSDGMEYSIQEARARSMGLLGKKWGPPPASEMPYSAVSSAQVDFNDDGLKTTKNMSRRRSLMAGAEPTVTINTKEALADVFGMYNSPEKTRIIPGSKHAPVKKIEPVTPIVPPRLTFARENENANAKTPATFRPFVDENAQPDRVTPAAKFTPFVDSDAHKTPMVTPRPAFNAKDIATPVVQNENAPRLGLKTPSVPDEKPSGAVFSKVFAPATNGSKIVPHRDVFAEEHKKDAAEPRAFTPFVDESAKTPFKVFSRPEENENDNGLHVQNAFTPKTPSAAFAPFVDKTPAFTPFRDSQQTPVALTDKTPVVGLRPRSALTAIREPEGEEEEEELAQEQLEQEHMPNEEDVEEEYEEEYQAEEQLQYEAPLANEEGSEEYDDQRYYRDPPLGGRFGQFNVMTPITERTCEYTLSTTPKDRYYENGEGSGSPRGSVFVPPQTGEREALMNAERLAAELQEIEYEEEEEEEEGQGESIQQQRREGREVTVLEERTASLSLAEKLSLSQSFHFFNPCNPFDPTVLSSLLSRIPSDSQFHDLRDQSSGQLDVLEKSAKKLKKASGASSNGLDSPYTLTLNGHRFTVTEKLGEGGFGSVFKARDLGKRISTEGDEDDDDDSDLDDDLDDDESSSLVAIKIVKPRSTWEYHVLRRLHSTLSLSLRRSLVLPHALYAYSDESFLILDLCPQGMLLNIVNNAVSAGVSQQGACLDELLVMFFSIELIRLVEGLHTAGFIHGDLKIDNCLLRLEEIPGGASAWGAMYEPSGDGGWSYKGLKVIDFGRTIDTRLFPSGQQYLTDWAADERDCFEIREGKPWTFQTDYFGLAGIVYCMLFGKYIQENSVTLVPESPMKRYKISTPLKRYWQGDIWNQLFDVLLNPCLVKPNGALPICNELAEIRKEMEAWLQANCNRSSNTLKGLLKKVEKSCYTT